MAIYKLDIERRFGQFHSRLYPHGATPGEFGPALADLNALVGSLDAALKPLALDGGGDSVIFRGIEYDQALALRETVRRSRY